MTGKIFITRQGYDPELGKHVKDPYLDPNGIASIGACRPDVRRRVNPGDHIFVISGKLLSNPDFPPIAQYVIGGFEVAEKLDSQAAYDRFPEQRLRMREDGQLSGNIVCDRQRHQLPLDTHKPDTFANRLDNYVVGRNAIALTTHSEIERGRNQTLEVLQDILKKNGRQPIDVVGRWGSWLSEDQIEQLREWLESLKEPQH